MAPSGSTEAPSPELSASVVDLLNEARTTSSVDHRVDLLAQIKELLLHRDSTGTLLAEYAVSVGEFQADPAAQVRKAVSTFLQDVCKAPTTLESMLFPRLFSNIVILAQDDNAKVAARGVLSLNNLFRRAMLWLCIHAKEATTDAQVFALSQSLVQAMLLCVGVARRQLRPGQDLLSMQAAKLSSTIALSWLLPDAPVNERQAENRRRDVRVRVLQGNGPDSFSAADFPAQHVAIDPKQLAKEATSLTSELVSFISASGTRSNASMAALNSLCLIVEHRPQVRFSTIPLLVELGRAEAPKGFKQALKTHGLHYLKINTMTKYVDRVMELLRLVGAATQAEGVLAKRAKLDPVGYVKAMASGQGARMRRDIDNASVEEQIEWFIANLKNIPASRPMPPPGLVGGATDDGKAGTLARLTELLERAEQARIQGVPLGYDGGSAGVVGGGEKDMNQVGNNAVVSVNSSAVVAGGRPVLREVDEVDTVEWELNAFNRLCAAPHFLFADRDEGVKNGEKEEDLESVVESERSITGVDMEEPNEQESNVVGTETGEPVINATKGQVGDQIEQGNAGGKRKATEMETVPQDGDSAENDMAQPSKRMKVKEEKIVSKTKKNGKSNGIEEEKTEKDVTERESKTGQDVVNSMVIPVLGRRVASNRFLPKRNEGMVDLMARLACMSPNAESLRQLVVETALQNPEGRTSLDIVLALLHNEYVNDLLFRALVSAPSAASYGLTAVKDEPGKPETNSDVNDLLSSASSNSSIKQENKTDQQTTTRHVDEGIVTNPKQQEEQYSVVVTDILMRLRDNAPDSDSPSASFLTLELKIFKNAPRITLDIYKLAIRNLLSTSANTVLHGLKCLNVMFSSRPALMELCVDTTLLLTCAPRDLVRVRSITLILDMYARLPPNSIHSARIRAFTLEALSAARERREVDTAMLRSLTRADPDFINRVLNAAMLAEADGSAGESSVAANATVNEEERLLSVFVAMCTCELQMLPLYLETYAFAVSPKPAPMTDDTKSEPATTSDDQSEQAPALARELEDKIQGLLRVISRGVGSSPSITLRLLYSFPPRSEELIFRAVNHLAELSTSIEERKELLKAVIELGCRDVEYPLWKDDVRVLAPLMDVVEAGPVRGLLGEVLSLPEVHRNLALDRIIHSDEVQLDPVELVKLIIEKASFEQQMSACEYLLTQADIYDAITCGRLMESLAGIEPLPKVLFRIIGRTLVRFESRKEFIVTRILATLVDRRLWETPQLWKYFMQCCAFVGPMSLQAVRAVPAIQFEEFMKDKPMEWFTTLKAIYQRTGSAVPPHVLSLLAGHDA